MKQLITSIVFLLLGIGGLHAQKIITTAGSEATGTGGISSYTIGQIVYTANTGTNGSVAQGVQQPFEISTTLAINETTINLELSIYPNPTTNFLILKVEKIAGLTVQLYDLQGKIITSKTVNSTSTNISLEAQPAATYFLNVTKNNQIVKIFKIIKN